MDFKNLFKKILPFIDGPTINKIKNLKKSMAGKKFCFIIIYIKINLYWWLMKNYKEKIILAIILTSILYIYSISLYPAFANNDSPEIMTAAYTLGVCHPPGYPFFMLFAKIFLLGKIGATAINMNFFSSFLAILVLIIFYFTVKNLFKKDVVGYSGIFILAFSFTFLKEAIQAKGGIYQLNLVFLGLIIFLLIKLFESFDKKIFYLLFYLYSLSLSNHWQTMILFFPVIAFVFFLHFKKINRKEYFILFLLIILGLTPYIYLPVRASASAVLNHGDPQTVQRFIKHILRINYRGEFEPINPGVLYFQIKEFSNVFLNSFLILWLLFVTGVFFLLRQNKKISIILFIIFLINMLSIILLFRRRQDSSCYYLPSVYIMAIFITCSIEKVFLMRDKFKKYFLNFFIIIIILASLFINYGLLNGSNNYLSYDYVYNILKTLNKNSIYFTSSGFDNMPIFYFKNVLKKRNDVKIVYSSFLAFDWGIKQFKIDFPEFIYDLKEGKPFLNMKAILEVFSNKFDIYAGYNFKIAEKTNIKHRQEGLILRAGRCAEKKIECNYFAIYSLRGIFNKNFQKDEDNFRLISNYSGGLVNLGNEFLKEGKIDMAIKLYKYAILLPYNGSKEGFYKNLKIATGILREKTKK